jgi:hypothetical protein
MEFDTLHQANREKRLRDQILKEDLHKKTQEYEESDDEAPRPHSKRRRTSRFRHSSSEEDRPEKKRKVSTSRSTRKSEYTSGPAPEVRHGDVTCEDIERIRVSRD